MTETSRKAKVSMPRPGEPIRVRFTTDGRPRYETILDVGPGPGGRRRQRRATHDSLTAARKHITQTRTDRARGVLLERSQQTLGEALDAWLVVRRTKVRGVTAAQYTSIVRVLSREFGGRRLTAVTRADIQRFASALAAAGRSRRTVSAYLFVLRSTFDDAVDSGVIHRNPAARVEAGGKPAKPREAMSPADIQRLRTHLAGDPLYAVWLLALAGLRRSEVLALTWADVDFTAGTLAVTKSRVPVDGSRTEVGEPKTRRGKRTLPLPSDMLAALRALREQQAALFGFEHARSGYIAVDERGRPLRPERMTDLWAGHCQAAGVAAVTLHSARHTSVTLMRETGVADHVVAAWHGHDEAVMRSVYTHADEAGLAAAGEALAAALAGDRCDDFVTTGAGAKSL